MAGNPPSSGAQDAYGTTAARPSASDWQEFKSSDERRYYYNKVTKQSIWEKPLELMTPIERADASTVWKEFTIPGGIKYFYDTQTKHAVWTIPEELKLAREKAESDLAREKAEMKAAQGAQPELDMLSNSSTSATFISAEQTLTSVPPEAKNSMALAGKVNSTSPEEKTVEDEPLVYGSKQDAKNAFKGLLESAKVGSDWTWEQAMRVIINDKRYGALRTLDERKQAFNEYRRKKLQAEEKCLSQRVAKGKFIKMLEESEELTSSIRSRQASTMFGDDERFKAVERKVDREILFRGYLIDQHQKEKEKAQKEHRRNLLQFREFLETCEFVKVDTQWLEVQDLLEDDVRCTRLEKIDRLEVFQEYIRDLEWGEEEHKRKRKVKESTSYQAVASNISGLFEDVARKLEKQYNEAKARVEETLKSEKVTVASTWLIEDLKSAVQNTSVLSSISDITLHLIYKDLIETAKKTEIQKRKRLFNDFTDKLSLTEEITSSSTWEECKQLVEDSSEYRFPYH